MGDDDQLSGGRGRSATRNFGPGQRFSKSRPSSGAREIAAVALGEHAARFPDLVPIPLETEFLADRDAAFAHAIYDAALRRWITLTYLLNQALKQPMHTLQPSLQGVLLSGAAQLLLLDRVPVHAALNESVELAKELVSRGAGGLVNAVLRRMAQMRIGDRDARPWDDRSDGLPMADGGSLSLAGDLLPADAWERLSVATSHPRWLLNRWGTEHAERFKALALHSLVQPPIILNTRYAGGPLPASLSPHTHTGSHVFSGPHAELKSLLAGRDDLWVQDPASSRAVAGAAHLEPDLVIDACAGQGTKTRQLAAAFPHARVIATDIDEVRFHILEETYWGHPRVRVVPHSMLGGFAGRADLVLLDVPCGNSGVLARRPEAKYRASNSQLKRLTSIQRQIIADAIPLLRSNPRGKLLYSTCSIDRQENQEMVSWAGQWHRLKVEHELLTLPNGLPGGCATGYTDGSFSALLG